ncbi:MAG: exodeoxyribonuclease VII large subunit [Prevotella sp.]|nr:exodeoxyribonuclease VII large subunit [Prevotella sp.]
MSTDRHDKRVSTPLPHSEGLWDESSPSLEGRDRVGLSLFELNSLVREVLETTLDNDYWVEAELSEVREVRGHCYMELVQKELFGNTPVARASAKCWQRTWMQLQPRFEQATGQTFHAGLKVLLRVHVNFHEAYGFSWIVNDIDPTYTMGEMARRRQEIVRQLKEEGVFDLQRELELPLFCQRIAVISSPNAAGYGDFCNQLSDNDFGLQFYVKLFPATMQGEGVEQSIIEALNSIYHYSDTNSLNNLTPSLRGRDGVGLGLPFDCVVIIRGGGATADLSGFDTLALAENVANFPIPIITGIGHERDESVLDMVAHTRVKTPTAAAAFLIDYLAAVLTRVNDCQETITSYVSRRMQIEQLRLQRVAERIPVLFSLVKSRQTARLDQLFTRMTALSSQKLSTLNHQLSTLHAQLSPLVERKLLRERHRLDLLTQRAKGLDPDLLLRRGYSITLKDGHVVRLASDLQPGDLLETRLSCGTVTSEVKEPHPCPPHREGIVKVPSKSQ